jgi:hypothetical protein
MSQLVIMGRAEAADRPLVGDEQWFTAADILSSDHLHLMVEAFRTILPETELDSFLSGTIEASSLLQAIGGLVDKQVLEMYDAGSEQFYVHTLATRQWLLVNRLIDRIVVQAVWPVGATSYYQLTQSGILGCRVPAIRSSYQSRPISRSICSPSGHEHTPGNEPRPARATTPRHAGALAVQGDAVLRPMSGI